MFSFSFSLSSLSLRLPWQGIKIDVDVMQRYKTIGRIKDTVSTRELGEGHPWEFAVYMVRKH